MLAALPGIGDDENTTKSSGINVICLWIPFAIRDRAAKGSPWVPVHKIHISFFFKFLAWLLSINIVLSSIKPLFIASSILVSIERPKIIIFRLFLRQVSTICLIRYIFDAKVAIITRPWWRDTISFKASSTLDSLFEKPSDKAFVESLKSRVTPLLPNSAILWMFAIGPIGVKSNLKSPVSNIVPLGVCIAIPKDPGIEWVVPTNSIVKYLVFNTVSSVTSSILL